MKKLHHVIMVKVLLTGILMIFLQQVNAQDITNKNVAVDAAGWKRVAKLSGASGRGYNEVTLQTRGGNTAPRVVKISWFKGWSNYGGLNIVSVGNGRYWSEARITFDGTYAYLEVNFTRDIAVLSVSLDQSAWSGGGIIGGTLPDGGGDVIVSAKFGRVNYGEGALYVGYNGNVGVNTTSPGAKLAVNGVVHSKEVKVDLNGWSDFVFEEGYHLPTLKEVEEHIKEKGHLKDIPNTGEVEKNGILVGEMHSRLLQKIEELTLYTIQQQKIMEEQGKMINELKEQIEN